MRSALLLFVAVPLAAQVRSVTPFQEQKAQALFREQLPCLGCHELAGRGGRSAPSLTTVADRRNAAYIRAVVEDPQRVVPGAAMPKIPMPPSSRELVIAYLSRNARDGSLSQLPARNTQRQAPNTNYSQWCASCHGPKGEGDGPNARYLPIRPAIHSSAAQMSLRSDDALFDAIAGGGTIMGKSARMPAFGASLSAGEIRSLVAYIRTLCACKGPTWSLDGSR